ncbi:MAG: GNAT family N-acetyltransferase [Rhodothermales bacterium]|nr:GNAT family N-acetyltransferase [Rhodothermales bacterium]
MDTILETERLVLGTLTPEDEAFILDLLNQPSFLRFIGDRGVRTRADARAYIQNGPLQSYARHGFGLYRVALKGGASPIGICGLLKRDSLEHPDLGFAFLPAYWSKGYASEAARAVLGFARETLGLHRILAITSVENEASMALLRKLGFHFERRARATDGGPPVNVFAFDL